MSRRPIGPLPGVLLDPTVRGHMRWVAVNALLAAVFATLGGVYLGAGRWSGWILLLAAAIWVLNTWMRARLVALTASIYELEGTMERLRMLGERPTDSDDSAEWVRWMRQANEGK